ncbi:FdhE protein [Salmonella enterica subsp. salamae]|nr:FdhE protein [Salmonella enterica subsp. salamae]
MLPRDKHWQKLLHSLIAELKPEMSGPALAVIENLEKASEQELEQMASALFASDFASVSSDKAPFIWGRALPLLGANGQPDPRQSPRGIRRSAPVLPGVWFDAGLQHGADWHHAGAALSAL